MMNLSNRRNVLVCVTMSLVLLIAFSSETVMAHRVVDFPKPGVKDEELGSKNHERIFRESKLDVTGSSSRSSPHGGGH
ncbi:hypothetical protein LINPERHAP2_LOCUS41515 [Linum perenne]